MTDFRKIFKYKISRKSVQWKADRRTYVTKLIVAFRNFANAPKNEHNWNRTDVVLRKFLTYNAVIVFAGISSSLNIRTANIIFYFQTVVVTPSTLLGCYTFLKTVLACRLKSTQNIEDTGSPEPLVATYKTTRRHNPEYNNPNFDRD